MLFTNFFPLLEKGMAPTILFLRNHCQIRLITEFINTTISTNICIPRITEKKQKLVFWNEEQLLFSWLLFLQNSLLFRISPFVVPSFIFIVVLWWGRHIFCQHLSNKRKCLRSSSTIADLFWYLANWKRVWI